MKAELKKSLEFIALVLKITEIAKPGQWYFNLVPTWREVLDFPDQTKETRRRWRIYSCSTRKTRWTDEAIVTSNTREKLKTLYLKSPAKTRAKYSAVKVSQIFISKDTTSWGQPSTISMSARSLGENIGTTNAKVNWKVKFIVMTDLQAIIWLIRKWFTLKTCIGDERKQNSRRTQNHVATNNRKMGCITCPSHDVDTRKYPAIFHNVKTFR